MKKDTAGNILFERIHNCNCGSTGGCDKCKLSLMIDRGWEWQQTNTWKVKPNMRRENEKSI